MCVLLLIRLDPLQLVNICHSVFHYIQPNKTYFILKRTSRGTHSVLVTVNNHYGYNLIVQFSLLGSDLIIIYPSSLIQYIASILSIFLTAMIPKKAFRKKSLKLTTNPDEQKHGITQKAHDYLTSSYNKNRYSADLFSHLKHNENNPLELMTSMNTQWAKNSNSKKLRNVQNIQNLQFDCQEQRCGNRIALADCKEIQFNQRMICIEIRRLQKELDDQKQHYRNLEYIQKLRSIIISQESVLKELN